MLLSAKHCLTIQRCPSVGLKETLACAIYHDAQGRSAEDLAALAQVPVAWLRRYAEPNHAAQIPAETLMRVARVSGRIPELFGAVLRESGWRVVPESAAEPTGETVLREFLDAAAAHGEVAEQVRDAARDGRLCADDRAAILRRVEAEQQQLAELAAVLTSPAPVPFERRRA